MRTIVIIQARMGSTRLPGKILKPLGDSVVLDYVVTRCKEIHAQDVIVATSTLEQDNEIEQWCRAHSISCYRGSEDDVLSRYYECAKRYNPDAVMRVTSDCPFVDYEMGSEMIVRMRQQPSDYILLQSMLPRGLAVELFSWPALQYIYKHGTEPRHREHVTYYGYEYPDQFVVAGYEAPDALCRPDLRITLDTEDDYLLCSNIAAHFIGDKLVSSEAVIKYLEAHPEVASLNAHIVQKPVV